MTTATGQQISLIHQKEKTFYETALAKYMTEYSWSAANDLRALDRLLLLEVQSMRTQQFLASGMDYKGVDFDAKEEEALRKAQKELGAQIEAVSRDLELTKVQREKDKHDSVAAFIASIKIRAKEHGVKREKELGRGLELLHELFATVGAFKRANDAEREKLGMKNADAIVDYLTEYIEPEFKAVDAYFRTNQQRFWVREM